MRKFFERFLILSLSAAMTLSLVSCSSKNSSTQKAKEAKDVKIVEDEALEGTRTQADWIDTAVIYEVNVRQYTEEGTFDAFSQHLQRLKDMGVNTLWFMPIYPIAEANRKGTLGSYYSIADYTSVNSEFGTIEDFKELVDTAHDMGFHIILDWVANHTGWDHTWITEHPEYYLHDEAGNIISPLNTDWYDVAQLDYTNEDMQTAMIEAMSYWVKDIGVDGFRCDYAQGVPTAFWEKARTELDKIKPVYMLAEDGTCSETFLMNAFDSDYNFNLYSALKFSAKTPNTADDILKHITEDLPYGSFRMNFIDNHDQNYYSDTLENRFTKEALGALYTVVFTGYGVPLIYSGNEESADTFVEFFEKDNIEFGDYEYEDLLTDLCHIKTENEPLYNGIYGGKVREIEDDNKSVIAYERVKNGKQITVVVNFNSEESKVNYEQEFTDGNVLLHGDGGGVISNEPTKLNKDDLNTLKPFEYYIILSE